MGTRSLWETEAGLGLTGAGFCARPKAAILAAVQGRRTGTPARELSRSHFSHFCYRGALRLMATALRLPQA